jgi:hypothetical protein
MYPFFLFQFREDLLGQSKKADDMSRVAGLDNQGIVGLQRQIMKGILVYCGLFSRFCSSTLLKGCDQLFAWDHVAHHLHFIFGWYRSTFLGNDSCGSNDHFMVLYLFEFCINILQSKMRVLRSWKRQC